MRRLASQLYVDIATFNVTTWHIYSAGCKCINTLVEVDRAL